MIYLIALTKQCLNVVEEEINNRSDESFVKYDSIKHFFRQKLRSNLFIIIKQKFFNVFKIYFVIFLFYFLQKKV